MNYRAPFKHDKRRIVETTPASEALKKVQNCFESVKRIRKIEKGIWDLERGSGCCCSACWPSNGNDGDARSTKRRRADSDVGRFEGIKRSAKFHELVYLSQIVPDHELRPYRDCGENNDVQVQAITSALKLLKPGDQCRCTRSTSV